MDVTGGGGDWVEREARMAAAQRRRMLALLVSMALI